MVQLLYNATPQSRTQMSLYQLASGREMVLPIDLATSDVPVPAAEDFTKEFITLWKETKGRLEA